MPKDEEVYNEISKVIELAEYKEQNSKIIHNDNERRPMQVKEGIEKQNSRLILFSQFKWEKLKVLHFPNEELPTPEFFIKKSDFMFYEACEDNFEPNTKDLKKGKIELHAELVEKAQDWILYNPEYVGWYRLFEDILIRALALQSFYSKCPKETLEKACRFGQTSAFASDLIDLYVDVCSNFEEAGYSGDKIDTYFNEGILFFNWPFAWREKDYYENIFDPDDLVGKTEVKLDYDHRYLLNEALITILGEIDFQRLVLEPLKKD